MGAVQNLKIFVWNVLNTQIRDFWKLRILFYFEEIILTTWYTITSSKISVDNLIQRQHIEFHYFIEFHILPRLFCEESHYLVKEIP